MLSNCLLIISYVLSAFLADYFLKLEELYSSLFWPSVGIGVYFYLLKKNKILIGLFLASMIEGLLLDQKHFVSHFDLLLFHFLNSIFLVLIISFISKIVLKTKLTLTPEDLYENHFKILNTKLFLLISLLLSFKGTLLLCLFNIISYDQFLIELSKWFLGDFTGIAFTMPIIVFFSKVQKSTKYVTFIFILLSIIVMKLVIFFYVDSSENSRVDTQNKLRSLSIFENYQINFTKLESVLESYTGYYNGSSYVDLDEFLTFSRSVYNTHQDIQSVYWIKKIETIDDVEKANVELNNINKNLSFKNEVKRSFNFLYAYPLDLNSDLLTKDLNEFPKTRELIQKSSSVNYPVFGEVDHASDSDSFGYASSIYRNGKVEGVLLLVFDLKSNFITKFLYGLNQQVLINGEEKKILSDYSNTEYRSKYAYKFTHGNMNWIFNFYYTYDSFRKDREINILLLYLILFLFFYSIWTLIFFTSGAKEKIESEVNNKTQKLKKLNDELIKISEHKTSFLANMSHEIRTPLNGIIATSQILKAELVETDSLEKIEIIESSGELLLMIVNDILDLTKIESDQIIIEEHDFDLNKVVNSVIKTCKHLCVAKSITVSFTRDSNLPSIVRGDSTRLAQILMNIINNAIKFSHENSVVEIFTESSKSGVLFKIVDVGIGMDENKKDIIFEPFTQADASTTRKYGGTGLGLNITKKLVKLMKGTIDFTSIEGMGTTFEIWLPLKQGNITNTKSVDAQSLISPSDFSILLVEDNPINVKVFSLIANKLNFVFDHAENGLKAINLHKENKYEIIFMDIQMPVMDGYKATQEIRLFDDNVIIIGLSANAFSKDIEEGMKVGMNNYLSKPVTIDKIKELFKNIV